MTDRLAMHYAQEAANHGGGYLMAMNMMAEDLRRAWEGRAPIYPEQIAPEAGTEAENISAKNQPEDRYYPFDMEE